VLLTSTLVSLFVAMWLNSIARSGTTALLHETNESKKSSDIFLNQQMATHDEDSGTSLIFLHDMIYYIRLYSAVSSFPFFLFFAF
jgi:hypothetical protein